MPRITSRDFAATARDALAADSSFKLGPAGRLEITHSTFRGRATTWLKERVMPNRVREANRQVLGNLERTLRHELNIPTETKIDAALNRIPRHREFAQRVLDVFNTVRKEHAQYTPQDTLFGEIDESRRLGYIACIYDADSTLFSPLARETQMKLGEVSDEEFKFVVHQYNEVMYDLQKRFPRLSEIEPPNLFRGDNSELLSTKPTSHVTSEGTTENIAAVGHYSEFNQGIILAKMSKREWDTSIDQNIASGFCAPKEANIRGAICHEYSHHLTLTTMPIENWEPKLARLLNEQGIATKEQCIKNNNAGVPCFDSDTQKNIITQTGLGEYAASSAKEFVAEALAWYMAPGYGKSVKPMPPYLKRWLEDTFSFLER